MTGYRKYLEVFKLSFKMQIIWRFDVAMTMVATVGRILAAWILWRAIFEDAEYVGVFTFQSMLSYYIISSFLTSLDMSQQISEEVTHLILGGRFSGHMVTPMNPLGFFGSMVIGESAFHLGFCMISAFLCALIFRIKLTLTADIRLIIPAVAMIALGLLFMICFHYLIGILTFKFFGIRSFIFIANNIIGFATGAMVPLALLPDAITNVMRFLPFYYVAYLPSMLLTGKGSSEAVFGLAVLLFWTAALLTLIRLCYNRFRVHYDGVGI